MSQAPYVIGIDLGTTHSALAYAPNGQEQAQISVLSVPQWVAQGQIEAQPLLPSFIYFPHESEGKASLPWDAERSIIVGEYARSRAAEAPLRVIASAKSWLCHSGIDRRGQVLPVGAPSDIEKISPVEASFHYLSHLSEAWNDQIAKNNEELLISHQEIILAVPASFDAAARDLTVEAAYAAGFEHLSLLEEPQAALYAWIAAAGPAFRKQIRVGDIILVIDIGGGTTDFSIIAAVESEGQFSLVRLAVGDHILLGGDNMDLALAHGLKAKLAAGGKELDRFQTNALTFGCRTAKEKMLNDQSIASLPVVLASRGSQLLGHALRTELIREDVETLLVNGFFPDVPPTSKPITRPRTGLLTMGLPYAQDAAVTRHLASFLSRQAASVARFAEQSGLTPSIKTFLHPTAVLFNGGVMKSKVLRERIMNMLNTWLVEDGAEPARMLEGPDLDLAVAKGGAAFGLSKQGKGLRIRGGTARSYYVGIESAAPAVPGLEPEMTALCLAPFGMEEGSAAELPAHELAVVVGEPVRFRFFSSSIRRGDKAGDEFSYRKDSDVEELSPIEVNLPAEGRSEGEWVPVSISARVTEVGTLLLEALPKQPRVPNERFRIELSVRTDE